MSRTSSIAVIDDHEFAPRTGPVKMASHRTACWLPALPALLALLALLGNTQAFSPAAFGSAKLFNKKGAEVAVHARAPLTPTRLPLKLTPTRREQARCLPSSRQDADMSGAGAGRHSQGHERGAVLCGGVVSYGERSLFVGARFFCWPVRQMRAACCSAVRFFHACHTRFFMRDTHEISLSFFHA